MTDGDSRIITDSGIEIAPVYNAPEEPIALAPPGEYPYTRGVYPTMYRGRPWTMRQYAGFTTAAESNRRYRLLLERGQTGLSVAFDLPTQLGLDSDDARAFGEVGRVGVPISTLDDMRTLFDGIDQSAVTTSKGAPDEPPTSEDEDPTCRHSTVPVSWQAAITGSQ